MRDGTRHCAGRVLGCRWFLCPGSAPGLCARYVASAGKPFIVSHTGGLDEAGNFGVNGERAITSPGARSVFLSIPLTQEKIMTRKQKQQPLVRTPTKKVADSRRVRYGNGCAPAKLVRSADAATADSGAVRFGNGCAPASLRK